MNKVFKLVDPNQPEEIKKGLPHVPFVVQDEYNGKFLVFYDADSDKYRYILLTSEDGNKNGYTTGGDYDTLEEMFENNRQDIILETELIIKGKINK